MILLFAAAHADDMAFSCPTLTAPVDGVGFRDVGSLGSGFLDEVLVVAQAYYDGTCPADASADTYTDACFTAAGDAIAVYHEATDTRIWWSLTVVPASGALTSLDLEWGWEVDSSSLVRRDELSVTWSGTLADTWPADGDVRWSRELEAEGSADLDRAETWDDGSCTWAATRRSVPGRKGSPDDWEIADGAQSLTVHEEQPVDCAIPDVSAVLDGTTWEIVPVTWESPDATDADGDGWTLLDADCDDADPAIHPCAADVACDGVDADCSGADEGDADGDGDPAPCAGGGDCDDADPERFTGAIDLVCDGIDQDCSGADYRDCDRDGHEAVEAGGDDCDDTEAAINPGATEIPGNGVDENCDASDDGDVVDDTGDDTAGGVGDTAGGSGDTDISKTNLDSSACGCAAAPAPSLLFVVLGLRRR